MQTAIKWFAASFVFATAAVSSHARAVCLTPPTPSLRAISDRVGDSPDVAFATASKSSTNETASDWGWRQALRAEAQDTLSQSAKARAIAKAALRKVTRRSPEYVELLTLFALNSFRADQAKEADNLVREAMRERRPLAQQLCLRTSLGELSRIRGHADQAVFHLSAAYAMASKPQLIHIRLLSAEKLARVMALGGDLNEAISLVDEVAAWNETHQERYALSNALYFRALFEMKKGDFQTALHDLDRSRALSGTTVDPAGRAFLDLQTCRALIGIHQIETAERICNRALNAFLAERDDAAAQAELFLARIDVARNNQQRALQRLDRVLQSPGAKSSGVEATAALRLRSEVHATLGHTRAALVDLQDYVIASDEERTLEQQKQLLVQRARFARDRQASKNRELVQTIDFEREQKRVAHQKTRFVNLAGIFAILLFAGVAFMAAIHRRRLKILAERDGLTGLLNRRTMTELADKALAAPQAQYRPITLVMLDLDLFKHINDTFGHEVGDDVLRRFADALTLHVPSRNLIARWGGEEFVILLQSREENETVLMLEAFRRLLETIPINAGGTRIRFSAGVCGLDAQESFASGLRRADAALYGAKRAGRNRTHIAEAFGRFQRLCAS